MKKLRTGSIFPWLFIPALALMALSCASVPQGAFRLEQAPAPPDYANPANWAALPDRPDAADSIPVGYSDGQTTAAVDVFFLHPTTYTGKRGDRLWNGPVDDAELSARTDKSAIKYQASIFNGSARVFAPRYRQAHLKAYTTKHRDDARQAFELAYQDVKAAFEYYLAHYNQGRPVIIASHSQGSQHGRQLLKEYFDGKPLQSRLVAAYLAGFPVKADMYQSLRPCEGPDQTGCYTTWRTYKKGYLPPARLNWAGSQFVCTNPLNWTTTDAYAPKTMNRGAVLRSFQRIFPEVNDAQVHEGILWVSKPRFPGSFLIRRKNYHVGDFNLFYINVRENVAQRVAGYLNANGTKPGNFRD